MMRRLRGRGGRCKHLVVTGGVGSEGVAGGGGAGGGTGRGGQRCGRVVAGD